ncbi:RNA pseudouridine synthase [Marivirga sp. S37H4]|uniref:RNA pseudouridine synthase n=1 Tax=Marivirga aurantiaca TaxID=2802615 RepID=A0A934X228_9BACT|nr:pseudouridine synthase [Marivirga aurantiaca]MBK6266885.1 RNA pseudouridine synthase [Marivirga aurantiaca]
MSDNHFIAFKQSVVYKLPEKFTFPFSYEPHPLTELAAKEVQEQLKVNYNGQEIGGKMYGVLVVRNKHNELGYLTAFSGQVEHYEHALNFVPPIHDRLHKNGFFKKGENQLFEINQQVVALENDPEYLELLDLLKQEKALVTTELEAQQQLKHSAKMDRKSQREVARQNMTPEEFEELQKKLEYESIANHYNYKQLRESLNSRISAIQSKVDVYENKINALKTERKNTSADLQQQLFNQYQFLNIKGDVKSLSEIFEESGPPPGGAGDCAAPKLLQYAFENQMKPLAMGEFWWGKAPKAELRKEGRYYPACSGKCKPILAHMLEGLSVEDDPMLSYSADDKEINILYEDDYLLVINKPSGLLTTPAKEIKDSVFTRMQQMFPEATGPLVAHRLDKLTSGLMIITKTKEIYKVIQSQFIQRTIKKTYLAVLEGIVEGDSGAIHLPLTVDENNRPMQKVCFDTGRPAKTLWKVLERSENHTMVQFTPISGRTHQLRVHAAHPDGLNRPIVGDKLYGTKADRLKLHAAYIHFLHPQSGKKLKFHLDPQFGIAK